MTTSAVADTRSVTITATGGGASRSATLTVVPESSSSAGASRWRAAASARAAADGSPRSSPGVDCTFTPDSTIGSCGNVFFPVGTEVRLELRAAADSQFRGWEFEASCPDAQEATVQAGVAHICRPVFTRR